MVDYKFDVYDTVRIINWGACYHRYDDWIKYIAPRYLSLWKEYEHLENGDIARVLVRGKHIKNQDINIYLVSCGQYVYMYEERGLEKLY